MKMDAAHTSESLVPMYQNTRHHIKEYSNLNIHGRENLKYKENSVNIRKTRDMNTYVSGRFPINTIRKTVPFVVGFSLRRSRFSPTAAYVECMMNKVAVGYVFL
jgi:hypothetical protein